MITENLCMQTQILVKLIKRAIEETKEEEEDKEADLIGEVEVKYGIAHGTVKSVMTLR